jgi:hypothetical protein
VHVAVVVAYRKEERYWYYGGTHLVEYCVSTQPPQLETIQIPVPRLRELTVWHWFERIHSVMRSKKKFDVNICVDERMMVL